jgi:riboflavin kinase/FMN adenylyltransferase
LQIVHGWDNQDQLPPRCVLTVGNFDGVHRGHQRIVAAARELAVPRDLPVVALTFEPHPLQILTPDRAPQRLTTAEQKRDALAAAGADYCITLTSTAELLHLTAEDFVENLARRLHCTDIVEGSNFGFGRGRRGNVETLQALAGKYGFNAHVIPPVNVSLPDGRTERVSSSLVRRLLEQGDVTTAREALGRPYTLRGRVIAGDKRGRSLGYPTANLAVEQLVPADGVYSGIADVAAERYRAAVSVGKAPTFGEADRKIEAFLLETQRDVYGLTMNLEFRRYLRAQRQFPSADELVSQIRSDVAEVAKEPL